MQTTTSGAGNVNRLILAHTAAWVVFIAFELFSFYVATHMIGSARNNLIYYPLNISLFYLHLFLLNRSFAHRQGAYLRASAWVGAEIGLYLLVKVALDYLLWPARGTRMAVLHTIGQFALYDLLRCVYFAGLATLYWSAANIGRLRREAHGAEIRQLVTAKEKAEVVARLAQARNAYLRQQLNPHLLFNTLNFIYSSVFRHSEEGSKCVLLLAEIMRFSMADAGEDGKIPLTDELVQLDNLIGINRYRYPHPPALNLAVTGEIPGRRFIPLVILTLAENVFKHGDLCEPGDPAEIRLDVSPAGRLTYYSRNLKRRQHTEDQRRGMGISHIRSRLEYTYPGSYRLALTETPTHFQTELEVAL